MPYNQADNNRAHILCMNHHWTTVHILFLICKKALQHRFCYSNYIEKEVRLRESRQPDQKKRKTKRPLGPQPRPHFSRLHNSDAATQYRAWCSAGVVMEQVYTGPQEKGRIWAGKKESGDMSEEGMMWAKAWRWKIYLWVSDKPVCLEINYVDEPRCGTRKVDWGQFGRPWMLDKGMSLDILYKKGELIEEPLCCIV